MHWETVLRWLALLACPLMMLLCMRGMFGRSCHKDDQAEAGSREAEIRALKERLARLEAERGGKAS